MTTPARRTSVCQQLALPLAGLRRAVRSMACTLFVLLAFTFLSSPGNAGTPCPAEYRPLGRVTGVSGTELVIANGRHIRLAAIELGTGEPADRAALEHVLRTEAVGREAHAAVAGNDTDRYGRLVALVRLDEPGVSSFENLQESLLRRGFAVARPEAGFLGCVPGLVQAERPARALSLGIWSRLPIPAWNTEALSARRGGFTIMAGRVRSVGNARMIDYLNFGVKWREDATVRVARSARSGLEPRGIVLDQLVGRYVAIRGHVVEAGGPAIDVTWSEQIEVSTTGPKDEPVSVTGLAAGVREAQETGMIEAAEQSGAEQAGD